MNKKSEIKRYADEKEYNFYELKDDRVILADKYTREICLIGTLDDVYEIIEKSEILQEKEDII